MSKETKNVPDQGKPTTSEPAYQVVARRYRPQGFEQLIGQNHVAQALSNAITTHRIGHAYLFTGARGVGKTSTARIFAKALNCVTGATPHPCGVCDSCEHISIGDDVDVLEIDGASNRGIDEIRQLRQNASIRPSRSRFKIYIIDEVHMLTREAFNALLKTLEEPPDHVKFIFCTTEANKIPITILSRCQRFDFAGIDSTAIADKLAQIAKSENVTLEDGVLETLARRAAGSMRDAQSLLEQLLSFAPEHIKLSDVHEMLGTADDQRIFKILHAQLTGETQVIFQELSLASEEGVDSGILIEQMMGVFRDLMLVSAGGDEKLLLYSSPARWEELQHLAKEFGIQRILASLQILDHAHNRMRFSTQDRTLLELALVRIAHLGEMHQLAVLLDQIKSGKITFPSLSPTPIKGTQRLVAQPANVPPATEEAAPVTKKAPSETTRINAINAALSESAEADPVPVPKWSLKNVRDQDAMQLWREAVKDLSMMLSSHALSAVRVRLELPNTLRVDFPVPKGTTTSGSKGFCEKDASTIAAAVQKIVVEPVQVRYGILEVETKEPEKQQKANSPLSPQEKYRIMAELDENPMILEAKQIFGAVLSDVDKK